MEKYINSSLAAGIIHPSSSPARAGFFFVDKKDKTLCPCNDYHGLKDITMKNRYPLPLISSTFELLQGAKVFTKLNLRNPYHLERMKEGDERKTAFNTPSGHCEYLVMPFDLTNAPAVFQALINDTLRDTLDRFMFIYLDDFLIFFPDKETHIQHVRQVLQHLLDNQLFVKVEKCKFHIPSVAFLSFISSQYGIQMDPSKVSAVSNFQDSWVSSTSTGISLPKFPWSPQAQQVFRRLKASFMSAPVLILQDPQRQFIVEVNALDLGIRAVLFQRSVGDSKLHPCAFLSRKLSPA